MNVWGGRKGGSWDGNMDGRKGEGWLDGLMKKEGMEEERKGGGKSDQGGRLCKAPV